MTERLSARGFLLIDQKMNAVVLPYKREDVPPDMIDLFDLLKESMKDVRQHSRKSDLEKTIREYLKTSQIWIQDYTQKEDK